MLQWRVEPLDQRRKHRRRLRRWGKIHYREGRGREDGAFQEASSRMAAILLALLFTVLGLGTAIGVRRRLGHPGRHRRAHLGRRDRQDGKRQSNRGNDYGAQSLHSVLDYPPDRSPVK
jgi:hypothetical protein